MKIPPALTRWLRRGAIAALLLALAGGVFWSVAPWCFGRPDRELAARAAAVRFYDRDGTLVYAVPGYDHEWRFPVPLAAVPPQFIEVILAVEDQRFYRHGGIDYLALGRAFRQNLTSRRVVSGCSTVTMQLARMGDFHSRSYWNKFKQTVQARGIENRLTKDEILELYLNHLPYGGKIVGVEAAAQYYFGVSVGALNLAEMAMLAGIPQRPNALRPDQHLERARQRQKLVLEILESQGVVQPGEAEKIHRDGVLRFRDFSFAPPFAGTMRAGLEEFNPQFFDCARAEAPEATQVMTTLDARLQKQCDVRLREQQRTLPGVADAACVVIENATGAVRVMIGTLDYDGAAAGAMVNAARAPRQPGSTLKPFIYGEAVEAGWLTAATRLEDAPLNLPDYRPGNFDGQFRGPVRADTALADSLNTPAVRILQRLTPERVLQFLRRAGFRHLDERYTGLALALGGMEVDLAELTNAYAGIARNGRFFPYRFIESGASGRELRLWEPGTAALLGIMLRRPLENAPELDVAWKTGTSNGNHDAWCVAWNPEYTVGVWFGNKTGTPSANLIGVSAAAPVAGKIFATLYGYHSPPPWPEPKLEGLTASELCPASGLARSFACPRGASGWTVAAIPLALCRDCRKPVAATKDSAEILSPLSGVYRRNPGESCVRLPCAGRPGALHWYIDGFYLGLLDKPFQHEFPPGKYRIRAVNPATNAAASAAITVL